MIVACPTCQRPVEWSSSPWRPFCSERCKLIDLGAWGSDQRAIPVTAPADRHLDDSEPDDDRP